MQFLTIIFFWALGAWSSIETQEAQEIASKIKNPNHFLTNESPLVVIGNSSLDAAKIVFLPEIHDDPESLTTQILMIAREKNLGHRFIVLDESLESLQKSIWDVFSQKTLEIIAAKQQRRERATYTPNRFEMVLEKLAKKFQTMPGQLDFINSPGVWTLANFREHATPFYGWDRRGNFSLTDRNKEMVDSLKKALANNDRVLVMAGARHIPDLEFLTSQKLLCSNGSMNNTDMNKYFESIRHRFGAEPKLKFGIGATAPIYHFLNTQRYAVVYNKNFEEELDLVVKQFQGRNESCLRL